MLDWVETLGLVIGIVDVICLLIMFYSERSTPEKIIPWALIFIIVPIAGFVIYLFIGQTWYADHIFRIKRLKDKDIRELRDAQDWIFDNDTEHKDDYAKVGKTLYRLGASTYTANNDVKLYTLGQDKFDDLYNDLRNAKRFIHLEYYIIRDDELGNELMDILIQKVKEGLEVKLLTDAFGIGKGPTKKIKEFENIGGEFALFHKVFYLALSPKKNNRNHRKIAVIDGYISYCGGFNIGDEYLGKGPLGFWRDTAVRMEGGAVYGLEGRFMMDWSYASKIDFEQKIAWYIDEKAEVDIWKTRVASISGGPDVASDNPIRREYLELIRNAKKSVYIHSPYFIPDASLKDAMALAVASGVDVRVIIPNKPDHLFVYWNNISSANEVMSTGVRVYQYDRGFVHSKTMVVDGEYCSVGSANFDDRSLVLNFETNVVIFSKDIGKQMDDAFMEDLEYCTEYSCEKFDTLTRLERTKMGVSRLFKNLT